MIFTTGEILVLGDSMESDIAMAIAFGSPSVLVAPSDIEFKSKTPPPSCITIRSLAELHRLFEDKAPFLKPK